VPGHDIIRRRRPGINAFQLLVEAKDLANKCLVQTALLNLRLGTRIE
jgi:hypothetical protein